MSSPPVVSALRGRRILPFRLAVSSSVWRSVLAVAADRPTSSRWLRNRGAHSSESAVIVNRNVFEALPKTPSRTTTSTTFHRLKPCGSPAADAYFTVFPGALQALPVKKFQIPSTAPIDRGRVDILRESTRQRPHEAGAADPGPGEGRPPAAIRPREGQASPCASPPSRAPRPHRRRTAAAASPKAPPRSPRSRARWPAAPRRAPAP